MRLEHLSAGKKVPDDIHVVIEIPSNSQPIKYELDKESGMMMVDRFLGTAMFYPVEYGFIPHTLSDDGDPVDVLVISPYSLSVSVVELYADIRLSLRRGKLIGDIDTLIAATALNHNLTLVTIDPDFKRVPDLKLMLLTRDQLY